MKDRKTLLCDIETYWNVFLIGFKQVETGTIRILEHSHREKIDWDQVKKWMKAHTFVGFNSMSYDAPVIWKGLQTEDVTNEILKKASDRIIQGGLKWWEVEDALDIHIPTWFKEQHIDLIEPQPNPFASLKILNGRLHGHTLKDLPYDPDHHLTDEEIDKLREYLHNDLAATELLFNQLEEPLSQRRAASDDLGINLMSKSDAQMGEAIIKKRAEKALGKRLYKPKGSPAGRTFKYTAPDFIKFHNPQLQGILNHIQEHEFIVRSDGKVELPKWLKDEVITIGESTYQMGIGGLHSTEANRSVRSGNEYQLIDADVGSYYPSIILKTGLYPKAIGPVFLEVYQQIKTERMAAKVRGKEIKELLKSEPGNKELLAEQKQCNNIEKSLKIALNGIFGKLGSKWSIVFAPDLLISVTLTGQLSLLMLIDRAEHKGIPIVSANTDGVVFRCPREFYEGVKGDRLHPSVLADITDQWEQDTGFDLEFVPYKAIYNQSVNSYYAIKEDGGHKRKGPYTNPWSEDPSDKDPRGQMMGNPQMTICSDAAIAQIKHGIPVSKTIMDCRDIRQFVTVIKASKGATWRDEYLGKVVRYYWGLDGDPIYDAVPHEGTGNFKKIPRTDGAIECMTLPYEFPNDIDYESYITQAEKILHEFGFYGKPLDPVKRIRLTKANKNHVLSEWAIQI